MNIDARGDARGSQPILPILVIFVPGLSLGVWCGLVPAAWQGSVDVDPLLDHLPLLVVLDCFARSTDHIGSP